jgi:Fur family ferric uptake transcriptional regulator
MAASPVDDALRLVRETGGRVTHGRRMVLEALFEGGHHHSTAADVIDAVQALDPTLHRTTVYRILDRLVELGVVDQVRLGEGPAVYHVNQRAHQHLVCESCGRIVEAPADLLDDVARVVERDYGFRLRPRATPLLGWCRRCASKRGHAVPDAD